MARVIIDGTDNADFLTETANRLDPNGYDIHGFAGNDVLAGSDFSDWLTGGLGNDTLLGGNGDDVIFGGDDNDLLQGGAGNDSLDGGGGNEDILVGGLGDDILNGNLGNLDAVSYLDETADLNIDLRSDTAGTASGGNIGNDILLGIEVIDSGHGNDHIFGNDSANNILRGMDGNDTVVGGLMGDQLEGGNGDDLLCGSLQKTPGFGAGDVLYGEMGNDTLVGSDSSDVLNGGEGDDALDGSYGADDIAAYTNATSGVVVNLLLGTASGVSSGIDTLMNIESVDGTLFADKMIGSTEDNVLQGFAGNDFLAGGGGNDTELGGAGNDVLWGLSGNNNLEGGAGNDKLIVGRGGNLLTGGDGADIFRFSATSSMNEITDFMVADDTIQLRKAAFAGLGAKGVLSADKFLMDATPMGTAATLLYDSSTGDLSYDADGDAAGVAVHVAMIGAGITTLSNADFVLV